MEKLKQKTTAKIHQTESIRIRNSKSPPKTSLCVRLGPNSTHTYIYIYIYIRFYPPKHLRTELKNGKAPGIDNVYNIILKKAIGTGFYKVLARAFTISLKLGFIPHVWKIAVLCMLIKPDKPPSQTTSYRPISLLSAIMKLFERVIEKSL